MNHTDHVNLLTKGIPGPGVWADFGSGRGAFTLALADLLDPHSHIISIDTDRAALRDQEQALRVQFPNIPVTYQVADFTRPLDLPPLDGLLMANSLHFHRDKAKLLPRLRAYLKPGGRFLLVEYNTDHGNFAVPYPFSFKTWEALTHAAGFAETHLLATRPSRFLGEIYSAVSW